MKPEELKQLQPGDIVAHCVRRDRYVVTGVYNGHITAVRTVDLTQPAEWDLVQSVRATPSETQ